MTVKHWRGLRQVLLCRHLNRQWQQQAAVWTDGGTKLWPVVHRRRHYWAISVWGGVMPCHLTPGRSDRLLHLSRSVLKTSCTHTISFSYSCCQGLVSCTVCLCGCVCVCVCVCLIDNYTIMTLLSPNLEYVDIWLLTWHISCKQVRNLSYFWWEILHNTIQWTYILTLWWFDWWFLWTVKLLCKIEPCCQLLFIICPRLCSSIGNLLILEKVT